MSRRIDDHSFWGGRSSAESVLPVGNKVKSMGSAVGAGSIGDYPDTAESVMANQNANISKAKARSQPSNKRT